VEAEKLFVNVILFSCLHCKIAFIVRLQRVVPNRSRGEHGSFRMCLKNPAAKTYSVQSGGSGSCLDVSLVGNAHNGRGPTVMGAMQNGNGVTLNTTLSTATCVTLRRR